MISRCFGHVFVVPGKGMDELPACTGFLVLFGWLCGDEVVR